LDPCLFCCSVVASLGLFHLSLSPLRCCLNSPIYLCPFCYSSNSPHYLVCRRNGSTAFLPFSFFFLRSPPLENWTYAPPRTCSLLLLLSSFSKPLVSPTVFLSFLLSFYTIFLFFMSTKSTPSPPVTSVFFFSEAIFDSALHFFISGNVLFHTLIGYKSFFFFTWPPIPRKVGVFCAKRFFFYSSTFKTRF